MSNLFNYDFKKNQIQEDYTARDIEVLEGLEPVRCRPGMYIGGTDENSLHHLVSEVFDNCMDEAIAGFATYIQIEMLEGGGIKISDNGRGIPVDPHPKYPKKSALEVILTTLHAGGKFGGKVYRTSGGLHGVGISVVNALSKYLIIDVMRDGSIFHQEYKKGIPVTDLENLGKIDKKKHGTSTTFYFDDEIFDENINFCPRKLYRYSRSKSYLFKGVEIRWKCHSSLISEKHKVPEEEVIHFPNGLSDYLNSTVDKEMTVTKEPFVGEAPLGEGEGSVEWAIYWIYSRDSSLRSYCNTIYTSNGGTHEIGMKNALLRGLREFGQLAGIKKSSEISSEEVLGNMFGILSVFVSEPQFQGQTKDKLSNKEVAKKVEVAIKDRFDLWLSSNKNQAIELLSFVIERLEERLSRKKERDIMRKSPTDRLRLPGKLTDCSRKIPQGTEIFFVEGDSAGGSAKMARDRETQAILPLRGKILNVASATKDKIVANQEINDINLALGCGSGSNYCEELLRYEKVVIMTDADVDGAHIASLLMTYFVKYMPSLIKNGHLYMAIPPLYRITLNSENFYVSDEKEKNLVINELTKKRKNPKFDISRFKGLGEMTPKQLRETTMNKKNRTLLKVMVTEESYEDTLCNVENLMGRNPEKRFKFITEKTLELSSYISENLDT